VSDDISPASPTAHTGRTDAKILRDTLSFITGKKHKYSRSRHALRCACFGVLRKLLRETRKAAPRYSGFTEKSDFRIKDSDDGKIVGKEPLRDASLKYFAKNGQD
jgi:hypothetical protein